jgi:hypothetical protein
MVMAGEDIRTFLRRYPRILRVGNIAGGEAEFITVGAALAQAALMGPTAANKVVILLGPGAPYAESNLVAVNGVDLVAYGDPEACQIVANDGANPIITVPNGVTCTFEGVRVENTAALGAGPGILLTGGNLTVRGCYVKATAPWGQNAFAIKLVTTAGTLTAYESVFEGQEWYVATLGNGLAHVAELYRCRLVGSGFGVYAQGTGNTIRCLECDFGGSGAGGYGTVALRQCSRVGTTLFVSCSGPFTLDHCDCGDLIMGANGVLSCIASSFGSVDMQNEASASLTLDNACEISGAITNVHASATFIVPRKRLGVGLGAPGLLADATQMDSIIGAGAPINQAPATRTTTDWARTVKVVHAGVVTAFPYNITLTGTAMLKGALRAVTEVITVTGAGTFRGVVPWHNISNWTSSGNIGLADTVKLQFDSRLGLEHRLRAATHLLACRKSPGGAAPLYRTPASFTLNLTQYTIEETGVAVVAGDNYEYWVVKG